jgi:hypothetical protein
MQVAGPVLQGTSGPLFGLRERWNISNMAFMWLWTGEAPDVGGADVFAADHQWTSVTWESWSGNRISCKSLLEGGRMSLDAMLWWAG